jgi:hypothetical protein
MALPESNFGWAYQVIWLENEIALAEPDPASKES